MKNLNKRGNFEEQWEKAFEGAEMQPSDDLWTKLDAQLANDQVSGYKRGLIFYKLVAAASIVLAISMGIFTYLNDQSIDTTSKVASSEISEEEPVISKGSADELNANKPQHGQDENSGAIVQGNTEKSDLQSIELARVDNIAPALLDEQKEDKKISERVHSPLLTETGYALNFTPGFGFKMLSVDLLPQLEIDKRPTVEDLKIIERDEEKSLWAGVTFASGVFDPGYSNGSFASANEYAYAADANALPAFSTIGNRSSNDLSETDEPGSVVSLGFNFGTKITDRFIIQSGISYMQNNSSAETSMLIRDHSGANATPIHVSNFGAREYNLSNVKYNSTQIDVNNQFEFISVPVKLGYVVLDNRFNWIVAGGVSTDFFLSNTLSDEEDLYTEFSVSPGQNSPYRDVFFNGLISTSFGYRFPESNYSISLEPSFMMSLNSLTKDNYYYNSMPRSFQLAMGFKYHFN